MPILIPDPRAQNLQPDDLAMLPHYVEALAEAGVAGVRDMAPSEVMSLLGILDELQTTGSSPTAEKILETDYWRTPPTIEEFCEDDYWLGSLLKKTQHQHGLFPIWRSEVYKAFAPGRVVNQIIITGCLHHDTLVALESGSLPTLGQLIHRNGPLEVRTTGGATTARGAADSGRAECLEIRVSNGSWIRVTADHEIECATMDRGICWRKASELEPGDSVLSLRKVEHNADDLLNDAEVKLLAYWPTDGSCMVNGQGGTVIRFTDGNRETCEEVVSALAELGWWGTMKPEGRGQKCWNVLVHNPITDGFRDWLVEHRAHFKTHDVEVPDAICRTSVRQLSLFLNRVWAAEGTVYTRTRGGVADGMLRLAMTSERFVLQIQQLLLRIGVQGNIGHIAGSGSKHARWDLVINDAQSLVAFFEHVGPILGKEAKSAAVLEVARSHLHAGHVRHDVMPFTGGWLGHMMSAHGMVKKHTRWMNLIQGQARKKVTVETYRQWLEEYGDTGFGEWMAESFPLKYRYLVVTKVSPMGVQPVGDVVDSGNQKWLANGISVHNCIGAGKTMVSAVMLLYRLARLLCLRDPIRHYGLAKISRLVVSCFSVTKAQVMAGAFMDTTMAMGTSPFFNEILPVGDRKFSDQRVQFPSNVVLVAGSRLHQALGGNVLITLIDEINFRLEANAAKAAKDLVNSLERRQESRFKQHLDTLMILISSAKSQADFLTTHIEKNRNNPRVVIWDFPLWDVRGGVTIHYSGARFLVDVGDNIQPPAILPVADYREREKNGTLTEDELAVATTIASLPAHRFLWVPEEHRPVFEADLEEAIRDVAGRATGRMAKFIPDVMYVINMLRDGIQDPFVHHTLRLSIDSKHEVRDALADRGRVLLAASGNCWRPRRHPHSPRYIHIDVSSGVDALGLVCVHPIYLTEVKRIKIATQESDVVMRPVYEVDFALRIVREHPHKELDFGKIRSFIGWLRDNGFVIRFVGCDLRHLSMEMRGILGKMGFNSPYLSVDTKRAPYDGLKQVIVEQRLHMFPHDFLALELVNLEDREVKIDHPDVFSVPWRGSILDTKKGSKDLADGLAGAIYFAETDKDHGNVPMFNPDGDYTVPRDPATLAGNERPPDIVPTF